MTEEEFEVRKATILSEMPEELRAVLPYYLWSQEHSTDYDGILGELTELVYMLKHPLQQYAARIAKETIWAGRA